MNPFILTSTQFNSIVERVKRHFLQCGVNCLRHFSHALKIPCDFGGEKVSIPTFESAVRDSGLPISSDEVKIIFARLDRSGQATEIDPTEFIAALRFDFSPLRGTWLKRVWDTFPKNSDGVAELDLLRSTFQPDGHPDVLRGVRSALEVQEEFFSFFDEKSNPEKLVTLQDFEQYYAGVSCICFDDETYLAILRGCWPIPGVCKEYTIKLVSGEEKIQKKFSSYLTQSEEDAITRRKNLEIELERCLREHRQVLLKSALAVRQLMISFQERDKEKLRFLSQTMFLDALRQHRVYLSNRDIVEVLDTNGDGSVDYYYYLVRVMPLLPPSRRLLLEQVWGKVMPRKDAEGGVEVLAFQRCFKAKTPEEQNSFADAWDVQKVIGGKVYLWEVELWYAAQSVAIERDADFESLLARHWPSFRPPSE